MSNPIDSFIDENLTCDSREAGTWPTEEDARCYAEGIGAWARLNDVSMCFVPRKVGIQKWRLVAYRKDGRKRLGQGFAGYLRDKSIPES